jgi:hypothetical protein
MFEYVHVDYEIYEFPHKVYYEPLDDPPDHKSISGKIKLEKKEIGFYTGFYPDESQPDHIFFLDHDYDPVVLAEFDLEKNRMIISYDYPPGEHYLLVFYRQANTNWKQEGF